MKEKSNLIIVALRQAAKELEHQDRQSAISTLEKISRDVTGYSHSAGAAEVTAKENQSATVKEISKLIKKQGEAHADRELAKKELDNIYTEIASKKVSMQELNVQIANHRREFDQLNRKLQNLLQRKKDLNDKSAWSIIRSILCLGLDRAIQAISIEIDGVNGQIGNIRNTINRFDLELNQLKQQIEVQDLKVIELNKIVEQKNSLIKDLEYFEFKFNCQEDMQRKRLVFFTEVNLFYIRLQNLLDDVSHKIEDVLDLVNELNNEKPRIESFDPSGQSLISLKQAIVLFGELLDKEVSMDALELVFEEDRWYVLSTEWLGEKRVLDIVNDGVNNRLVMADAGNYSGQHWKIKSAGDGYFRLTTEWLGEGKSLAILDDGKNNTPVMSDTGDISGQLWKIEPEFGFLRLTCMWLGERKSLDIINDGTNNRLVMADSGNYSGQHWRLS